jgi:hypothetical protein
MSLYAVTLDRFHGSAEVARDAVRSSKQRLLSGLADVQRFEMYDVRLAPSRGGSVVAEFRVEADAQAPGVAGWYRLQMRQVGTQWKIYGEERIQPVSRGRAN